MVTILALIILEINGALKNNEIKIENNILVISGDYGFEINLKDVKSIRLENDIPNINSKTNGVNFDIIKKGTSPR